MPRKGQPADFIGMRTARIIPWSDLPQTSNNIIQKGLAFGREQSGTATVPSKPSRRAPLGVTSSICASDPFDLRPRVAPSKLRRYGALLPLFRLVGVRCIAALERVASLRCHCSDRPKLAVRSQIANIIGISRSTAWRAFPAAAAEPSRRGQMQPRGKPSQASLASARCDER